MKTETVYTVFINGGRAGQPGFEYMKTRLGRPSRVSDAVILTEDDIPGAALAGRNPFSLNNEELKFGLRCRGDSLKGLKTKAQLIKRQATRSQLCCTDLFPEIRHIGFCCCKI